MSPLKLLNFLFMAITAAFGPLNIQHGNQGCCAECALKRPEEIELKEEQEEQTVE